MRPTRTALIQKACPQQTLFHFTPDNLVDDDAFMQAVSEHSDSLIYCIVEPGSVDIKLYLTAHQFTNVVGTDIYIYIGNANGQKGYAMILDELSQARRLDEKIMDFIRTEANDCLKDLSADADTPEHFAESARQALDSAGSCPVVCTLDESKLNRNFGQELEALHFASLSDSHVFVYTGSETGEALVNRIMREPFMQENI